MAHTKNKASRALKLHLRCPECGSADLATAEQLTASCRGHATLTIEAHGRPRPEFHHDGWTDVDWDSSTTIGIECRSCQWSYDGYDHLGQLTFSMKDAY